jgi:hypothetical protein
LQSIKGNVTKLGPALTFTPSFIFKTFRGCDKRQGEQVAVLSQKVVDMSQYIAAVSQQVAV